MTARGWPRSPSTLSRRIREIQSNLLEGMNIKLTINRETRDKNRLNAAIISIEKISPVRPASSLLMTDETAVGKADAEA